MFNYKNYIFDVGANNGINGLAMSIYNKDCMVLAFEPDAILYKTVKKLKKKLEKRIGYKILNYKIFNYAVSNKSGYKTFYIRKNRTVSSLNKLSKNIDKFWPGYKNRIFEVKKKIKVKSITLYDFMKLYNISHINYLHIDTQGHDLVVLNSLKNKIKNVDRGVMEVSLNKNVSAYQNGSYIESAKKKLKKNNFKIQYIDKIEHLSGSGKFINEANLYFKKNLIQIKRINLNFNLRYFQRVLNNKNTIKDNILDLIKRIIHHAKENCKNLL